MTLRDYQQEAVTWLAGRFKGVVVSPAGSGKTLIAAAALDTVIRRKTRTEAVRIGWLANTKEQCQQARLALDAFPLTLKQDVKIACAAAATDWSDRDALIVDECHHSNAPGWAAQIATCPGARWGFTATPPDDQLEAKLLRELLGESFTITRERVQRNLAPAVVRWLDANDPGLKQAIDADIQTTLSWRKRYWSGDPGQLWGQVAWQICVKRGIVENKARNAAAIAAAVNDRPTLVLVNQVEHGQTLSDAIAGARPCYSAMGAKLRRETLADFTAGRCRCIVATSLADEGLDLPNAAVLVLVSGGRSKARTEQRTGRVLREFAGKPNGTIYDFRDSYHPLAAKHARVRAELYEKLGYKEA